MDELLVFGYLDRAPDAPVGEVHDAVRVRTAAGPPRIVERFRLGPVDACVFEGDRVDVVPHHRAPERDGLIVGYVAAGTVSVTQLGHTVRLRAGQLALYDGCTAFRITAPGPHRYLVVRVPPPRLRSVHPDAPTVLASDISGHPSVAVLTALLGALLGRERPMSPAAAAHLGEAVVACVHAVVADANRERAPGERTQRLYVELGRWLDEHLADPSLSAQLVAEAAYLSVRYVRQVFAEHGTTVSAYVRTRRLERIRADLLDPRLDQVPVSAVASRWGMTNASVFSRSFHRAYGVSPDRYRRGHRAPSLSGGPSPAAPCG